jgi:DNA polymerase-3 subunit epsilon
MGAGPGHAKPLRPPRRHWRATDWCVVDLETTGLDAGTDEIISFGAVPIRAGRILSGESVYSLVRPARSPSPASVRIHGLRTADLADSPTLDEVIGVLTEAMGGCVLVAHHASMERTFLTPALSRHGVRVPRRTADTEVLGRHWFSVTGRPAPARLSLTLLAQELGLPVHRPHDALGDALTTAQAFIALATHLDVDGARTASELCSPARPRPW